MQAQDTFQPVIVAVGPATRIEKYYVVINEKLYAVDKALEAIELALKVFFCLDCKYPKNSEAVWCFLQRVFFNIDLLGDAISLDTIGLVEHIRKL